MVAQNATPPHWLVQTGGTGPGEIDLNPAAWTRYELAENYLASICRETMLQRPGDTSCKVRIYAYRSDWPVHPGGSPRIICCHVCHISRILSDTPEETKTKTCPPNS